MKRVLFVPAFFLFALLAAPPLRAADGKNLQVLDKNMSKDDIKKTMEGFAAQLGVKCQFCHVNEEYEKDDKKQKSDARKMIKLVLEMKARKPEFFKTTVKETAIQCSMCHRGRPQPEAWVP
jgi:mannose/fructose/N-acetylgalactosamine-specific phosphotransferase system component IIB